jgi:uncharacterized protein YjiS (DUF1127 family)
MRKLDEYLATIDTIYPDRYQRESIFFVTGEILSPAPMPAPRSGLAGLMDGMRNWVSRRRGRQALLDMSDEQLSDIGITRHTARLEAAKSRFLE